MSVINTRRFSRFWPVSWAIAHRFVVPERFPQLTNPEVRLRVGHQHSQFWPIMTRFMGYYSPFCGPEVISLVAEPQGVLMYRSLRLADLDYSGLFHGLLLTILGSQSDFHGC